MIRSLAALTALAILQPGLAASQWKAPPSDSLRPMLADRIAKGGSAGLVLGVVEGGAARIVASGPRGGAGSAAIDGKTVFEIGSVSKVFTTILLAEMVGRGEVALEDPVQKLLPAGVTVPSRNGKVITLLDLATASSGLPRMPTDFKPADPANPYADYTVAKMYAFISSQTLPRDPGAIYEYSNLGMGLLGQALAERAGKPYEQLVTERILQPLGMSDTRISLTGELKARLAQGHDGDLEPAGNWDIPGMAGAGAWRSTASDMLRFLAACINPPADRLGEAIRLSIGSRRPAGAPTMTIGLGWHILQRGDRRMVWHNGGTGGYHSFVGFDPVSKSNALVLSNSSADIDDIGRYIIDPTMAMKTLPAPRPVVAVADSVLQLYVGRYELSPGFSIEISRSGSVLSAQATNQPRFRLFASSPARFFLRVVEAEVEFKRDSAGTVTGLVLFQGGRESPGRRLP